MLGGTDVQAIQSALARHQTDSAERVLLQRLDECLALYDGFDSRRSRADSMADGSIADGMAMDLTRFPGESAQELTALDTLDELDQYTYYVAGCVGEFWTRMVCAHRPAMARWDVKRCRPLACDSGRACNSPTL